MTRHHPAPGETDPGVTDPATTRGAILAAARAEIAATGSFTVNGVAARAGVSRQAIHYHFGGGRGVRAALSTEGLEGFDSDITPTRERIVAAAERLLRRTGSALTMEAVGMEAGMTKGAVYHHFPDRAALIEEVAVRMGPLPEISAAVQEASTLPLREALATLAGAYYRAMTERADIIRNMAAITTGDPELTEVVMSKIIGQAAPSVFALFRPRIAAGEIRAVDPSLVIQALFAPVFMRIVLGGAAFEKLRGLGIRVAADHLDEYIDLLVRGLAADA